MQEVPQLAQAPTTMPKKSLPVPGQQSQGPASAIPLLEIPEDDRNRYLVIFDELPKVDLLNRATPDSVRATWMKSQLSVPVLRKIWALCDPRV